MAREIVNITDDGAAVYCRYYCYYYYYYCCYNMLRRIRAACIGVVGPSGAA